MVLPIRFAVDVVRYVCCFVAIGRGRRPFKSGVRHFVFRFLQGPSDAILHCACLSFGRYRVYSIRLFQVIRVVQVGHYAEGVQRSKNGARHVQVIPTSRYVCVFSFSRRSDHATRHATGNARLFCLVKVDRPFRDYGIQLLMADSNVLAGANWCFFLATRFISSFPYALFFFRVSLGSSFTGSNDSHPFPRSSESLCFVGQNEPFVAKTTRGTTLGDTKHSVGGFVPPSVVFFPIFTFPDPSGS